MNIQRKLAIIMVLAGGVAVMTTHDARGATNPDFLCNEEQTMEEGVLITVHYYRGGGACYTVGLPTR